MKAKVDPVIAEVYKIRDQFSAEHDFNIKKMFETLRKAASKRRSISRREKPLAQKGAA